MVIRAFFAGFILLGFGLPAWVYFQIGFISLGIVSILVGILWIITFQLGCERLNYVGIVIGITANGYATWFYHTPLFLILGSLACLGAWDLSQWQLRLKLAAWEDEVDGMSRRHIQLLLIFLAVAGLISLIAIKIPVKIGYWPGVGLLVLTFVGLLQLLRNLVAAVKKEV
jgi:hypothetical protein